MSDLAPLGPHGLRLLKQFEKGPLKVAGVPWPRSPNGAALRSYQCSANKWTIGWGCTEWFDGSRVGPGYVLADEASADKLLQINMVKFLLAVDRLVKVPINSLQRDALACLAMNIGEAAFADSTALRETNNGNFELAAEGFGLFSGATTYSPTSKQIANPEYAGAIGQENGKWIWVGPQGQKCGYMTRLSGLRRRHMSEAMLYKSYDWQEACAEGNVVITLRPPSERMWNGRRNRWEDRIKTQTSVADVEYIAERHPLDESELVLFDMQPVEIDPGDMPVGEVELEPVEASTSPTENVEAALPGPAVGAQPPAAQEPAQSVSAASNSAVLPAAKGAEASPKQPASVQAAPPTPAEKPKTLDNIAKDAGLDRNGIQKAVVAVLVWIGYTMRTVGANGMKIFGLSGSTVSVLADQLNQPFVQILIGTAFFVCICGVLWAMGLIAEKAGLKTKKAIEKKEAT